MAAETSSSESVHGSSAEARRRRAEIILDEMFQFTGLLDTEGTLLEVNQTALDAGGLARADVVGRPFWEAHWWTVSEETQTRLREALRRARGGEFVRYEVEVYGSKSGSALLPIDFSVKPVLDRNDEVTFLLVEGRDIAEKRAMEAEILQNNADLARLNEELAERDSLRRELFSNVSHELRTPLTLILGAVERDPEAPFAALVARNARVLLKRVNDLLDVSRMAKGAFELEFAHVDLAHVVRAGCGHFQALAEDRNHPFEIDVPATLPAPADPDAVQRVLMNLLSNAFKFTPPGCPIRCSLSASDDTVTLVVEDGGPGIPPEQRARAFERFRQVDGSASRRHEGTGLGLPIVRSLVELHSGDVTIDASDDLGGAMVCATFPLHREDVDSSEVVPVPAHPDRIRGVLSELHRAELLALPEHPDAGRPTVVVVDDNPDMAQQTGEILSVDFHVRLFDDPREALRSIVDNPPDLVVTDAMMPGLSGSELVAAVRERRAPADLPIVVTTARVDDRSRVELHETGVQAVLGKPFHAAELLAIAHGLLSERERHGEERREANAVFRAMFEQAAVGISRIDAEGYFVEPNDRYCEITGYPCAELERKTFMSITHEDDLDIDVAQADAVVAGEIDNYTMEKRYIRKDGSMVWVALTVSALDRRPGAQTPWLAIVQDISERKNAEARAVELTESLERRVLQRTEDLEAFSYSVSHDLRAPLRAIAGFSTALEEDASDKLTGRDLDFLQRIGEAATRMDLLITELLAFSRLGKDAIELTSLQLESVVQRAILDLPSEQRQHVRIDGELPRVRGHRTSLHTAVGNLLSNALKFVVPGETPVVTVRAEESDEVVRLYVEDRGIGIDAAAADHVFEVFRRLHGIESYPGTGVGLAVVKRAAELHGGRAGVTPREGGGSSFWLEIPTLNESNESSESSETP